jgi:hypothetical protein
MARPTNEERYSPQAQKERLRELCGDALLQMKKLIKEADFQTLSSFVIKTLPIITNENYETQNDVTMDVLIKKSLKVQIRIDEANEQNMQREEVEDNEVSN